MFQSAQEAQDANSFGTGVVPGLVWRADSAGDSATTGISRVSGICAVEEKEIRILYLGAGTLCG